MPRRTNSRGRFPTLVLAMSLLIFLSLVSCGSGDSAGTSTANSSNYQDQVGLGNCSFSVASLPQFLEASDVEQIVAQGVQASAALGTNATLAVVDRVGNVLAVYQMNGAIAKVNIGTRVNVPAEGLDGLNGVVGSELAAIAKAITGAYLSSSGNAFSTRTVSYIIQNHFAPGILGTSGGPLFGAQFSQLPCGDLVTRGTADTLGPKRSPLGLAADPGGFPLYKGGQVVGGVGVIAEGKYGLDLNPAEHSSRLDEQIAQSAIAGFVASNCIRADRITVNGLTLPYSNSDGALVAVSATSLSDPAVVHAGSLLAVPTYFDGATIRAGTMFGSAASGFVADSGNFAMLNGVDLVNANGSNRYPPTASADLTEGSSGLTASEVQTILSQALSVANQARGQIRVPLGSIAEVTISVVDLTGQILGVIRSPDAPIFGIDISVQKARTAAFFSSQDASAQLAMHAPVAYLGGAGFPAGAPFTLTSVYLNNSAGGAQQFFGNPSIFENGIAFSDRSIANIARPNFPDGIDKNPNGPFSRPLSTWSIFDDGLQLDLIYNGLIEAIVDPNQPNNNCTGSPVAGDTGIAALSNGIQIFPGGFPIYRHDQLVGGIGVSGDGVDQDDMVAFLGLSRAGQMLNTGLGQAPASLRADTLSVQGLSLLYAQCPVAPFNDSTAQNVCGGF